MTRLSICILSFLLITSAVFAQSEEVEDQTTTEPGDPYYLRKGAIGLHLGNSVFLTSEAVGPQLSLTTDFTVARNVSIGPMFVYFKSKECNKNLTSDVCIKDHVRYAHFMTGAKTNIHLTNGINRLIGTKIPPEWMDIYIHAFGGYNLVFGNHEEANKGYIAESRRFVGGAGLGIRSMVAEKVGFFIEGQYSSYSYMNFGISAFLGEISKKQ